MTKSDKVLSKLLGYVKFGWPSNDSYCAEYSHVKQDLSVHKDVVLFRNRIVVPSKIRPNILDLLHASHSGMVAMKAEARQTLWWPGISEDIEDRVKSCNQCIVAGNQKVQAPLKWEDTGKVWERVHIDYCGPIENKYLLVVVDSHSKFIDVFVCNSTSSSGTIECLRRCFANFGIPSKIVSDNAAYFVSDEIRKFYAQNNIELINPAPFNPSSNGLAERAVQTVKSGLKKFTVGSLNTRVSRFLYSYRRSVHSITKISPDQVMFNRKFKSPLDINISEKKGEIVSEKVYDNKFSVGQAIFAKNYGRGKQWLPGIVLEVRGMRNYVVKVFGDSGDFTWRRHIDQLKLRGIEPEKYDLSQEDDNTSSESMVVPPMEDTPAPVVVAPQAIPNTELQEAPPPTESLGTPDEHVNSPEPQATPQSRLCAQRLNVSPQSTSEHRTRSGRVVKPPSKLNL